MRADLIEKLIKTYGYNEPIMTEEILSLWSEYSRPRVFQLLKGMTEKEVLKRFDIGVYYVPKDTILGKSALDPGKVIEKRFIKSGNEIFGYYTGLIVLNQLGLTTQMPYTLEIVTAKETTRVRKIKVGKANVLLRRAKTQITKANAPVLQLLEAFKDLDVSKQLDGYQLNRIDEFIRNGNIKADAVYQYAKFFPKRALNNLIIMGVQNVIG